MPNLLRPIPDALWQEVAALGHGAETQSDALKAVLSVLLAVGLAMAMHLPDIVWAALSGFLVMKSSLAEALPWGLNRVLGTLTLWRLRAEDWLAAHWHLITHATRAAIAVALLPLVWRAFGITDFVQTAVTSYIVMIVPAGAIERGEAEIIYQRMLHRALGCLIGALFALLLLRLAGDDLLLWGLSLSAGVWIGVNLQAGRSGLGYVGVQFAIAFLFTFVQGPGPATSVTPGLERLLGIVIGALMMLVVILVWPPAAGKPADRRATDPSSALPR